MLQYRQVAIFCIIIIGCTFTAAKPLEEDGLTSSTTTSTSTTSTDASTSTKSSEVSPPSGRKYLSADDVPLCFEKNADLSACVQRVFEIMLPRLKNGDESLNIPSLDPLTLNRTTLQAQVGPVTGRIVMKRGMVSGLSNMSYQKVDLRVNGDKLKLFVRATLPQVEIFGNYKADLSVNNAHLRPKGIFNLTMIELQLTTETDSELYEKDDHRFVRVVNLNSKLVVGDMKINITGIFPDPELNEIVVNVLNEHWREIYTALLPEVINYTRPFFTQALNDVLEVVPFDNFVKSSK